MRRKKITNCLKVVFLRPTEPLVDNYKAAEEEEGKEGKNEDKLELEGTSDEADAVRSPRSLNKWQLFILLVTFAKDKEVFFVFCWFQKYGLWPDLFPRLMLTWSILQVCDLLDDNHGDISCDEVQEHFANWFGQHSAQSKAICIANRKFPLSSFLFAATIACTPSGFTAATAGCGRWLLSHCGY